MPEGTVDRDEGPADALIAAIRENTAAHRASTKAATALREEVARLAESFARVLSAEPRRTPEANTQVDVAAVAGDVTARLVQNLFSGRKKR